MSTPLKLEQPWAQVKEKIKEIKPELGDEDLEYSEGNADELLNRLAAKMDRTPEEVRGWVESVSFNKGKAG